MSQDMRKEMVKDYENLVETLKAFGEVVGPLIEKMDVLEIKINNLQTKIDKIGKACKENSPKTVSF